jgi:hypothetical protein
MIRICTVVAMLAVSGCAMEPNYQQQVDTWIGSTESELVERFGPPSASATIDGGYRVVSWDLTQTKTMDGTMAVAPTFGYSQGTGTGAANTYQYVPGDTVVTTCRLTFKLAEGKVVSGKPGPGC